MVFFFINQSELRILGECRLLEMYARLQTIRANTAEYIIALLLIAFVGIGCQIVFYSSKSSCSISISNAKILDVKVSNFLALVIGLKKQANY